MHRHMLSMQVQGKMKTSTTSLCYAYGYAHANPQQPSDQYLRLKVPDLKMDEVHLEPGGLEISRQDACLYGAGMMTIRASCCRACIDTSSHSHSTFTIPKLLAPILDLKFADWYKDKYQDRLLAVIRNSVSRDHGFRLGVFRLGFNYPTNENSIVVHLVLDKPVGDKEAKELVKAFAHILSTPKWEGEQVHIDVCDYETHVRGDEEETGIDQSMRDPRVFDPESLDHGLRLPGSSIGTTSTPGSGTLSCFIDLKIQNVQQKFGLACAHVLQPGNLKPYAKTGDTPIGVTSPSSADFIATKIGIDAQLKVEKVQIKGYEANLKIRIEEDSRTPEQLTKLQKNVDSCKSRVSAQEDVQKSIAQFDINLGTVFATSHRSDIQPRYKGRMDWGIIALTGDAKEIEACQNLFCNQAQAQIMRVCQNKSESITAFEMDQLQTRFQGLISPSSLLSAFAESREIRLEPQIKGELFFKLPSRTSEARAGRFNGVPAIICRDGISSEEWCFICSSRDSKMSESGDSGALLVDSQLRPSFVMWGGGWGAKEFRDCTYATPFEFILEDVGRALCDGGLKAEVSA